MSKQKSKFAEWSTEYINDLPDSAFMFIEEGGEKDEEGKTKPRSLRHLPYKDKEGNIDLPHVRNALARLNQVELKDGSKLSEDKREEIRKKLEEILKENTEQTSSSDDSKKDDKKTTQNSDEDGDKKTNSNINSDGNNTESGNTDNDGKKEEETGKQKSEYQNESESEKTTKKEFIEFIASHYDGVEPDAVANLLGKAKFTGINEKKLANLVSNVVNEKTDNVLKYFENAKKDMANYNDEQKEQKQVDQFSQSFHEALQLNDEMLDTLNKSRKELDSVKELNEDLLRRLNDKDKQLENMKKQLSAYEEEKKEQKVKSVFDQYCNVFEISEGEEDKVWKMLSNMSEDMLEQTQTLINNKPKSGSKEKTYTKPSNNLSQYEDTANQETQFNGKSYEEMTPKEKTEYLHAKYLSGFKK